MCLFQLTRIEYYFSYKFLVTSFKKSTSKALRKKEHIDKKKFMGGRLTTPSPPAPEGLRVRLILYRYSAFSAWHLNLLWIENIAAIVFTFTIQMFISLTHFRSKSKYKNRWNLKCNAIRVVEAGNESKENLQMHVIVKF